MVKKTGHSSKKRKKQVYSFHLNEEDAKTERILIENFVALQRVITHLSEKFDSLATQISKMLNLFEISAKSLAEKEFGTKEDTRDVKKMMEKLDGLIEQNKTIAKGLLLLHDEVSPTQSPEPKSEPQIFAPRPIPSIKQNPAPSQERYLPSPVLTLPKERYLPTQNQPPSQTQTPSQEKYQKSISSEEEDDFSSKQQPPGFKSISR